MAHSIVHSGGAHATARPARTRDIVVVTEVLFLAPDAADIGRSRDDPAARVTSDTAQFRSLLSRTRPGMVVAFAPPATNVELDAIVNQRRKRRDMRAVLINAQPLVEERLAMLRAGFDEALAADIDAQELVGRLKLISDHAMRARSEQRIHIGPEVVLDIDARELRLRDRRLHLRPRECELLAILARAPGRTFSRQQLLDAVGATSTVRDQRTIDVHVRWLREKLESVAPPPARLITARGVGYRLEREVSR